MTFVVTLDPVAGWWKPRVTRRLHLDRRRRGVVVRFSLTRCGDPNGDGRGLEVQMLKVSPITELQRAYIRKVIDTIDNLDNVL